MSKAPGYPLPSGELGSDEIVCQLVYLPDRPEYWQAFYAALHYMTTWRAWERDDDRRGKDAAANWRAAFELTSGCWRMTCLDQLQDDVAEILAIMQLGNQCCDDIDVTDGDQYTDRVEDGEGDVPQNIIDAGYAEDAADWDGFDDYKCMISNVTVDQIPARLLEFAPIVNSYGAVAGGAAAVAAILAVVFGTGGLALVFGLVAGVGAVSLLYESLLEGDLLVTLAAKVVTNKAELVCSVYMADGDVNALVALNDKIDELFTSVEAVILKNMNLGPTLKALYAGRYDQQDIAEILEAAGYDVDDFDCSLCSDPIDGEYRLEYNWLPVDSWENWVHNNATISPTGDPDANCIYFNAADGEIYASMQLLRIDAGIPTATEIQLNRVRFHHKRTNSTAGDIRISVRVNDTSWTHQTYPGSDHPTWDTEEKDYGGLAVNVDGIACRFSGTGLFNSQWIDTVQIDFDATIP